MTGSDPDYISAMEHFEAMRHEDIHRATQQIDAGEILRISGTWIHAATTLQTSFPLTRASADRVMNAMEWDGEAAEAAFASTRVFADSVEELAAVIGQVGLRLGAVAAAAEAVKIAVVPPGDTGPVGALARLLEAANVLDAQIVQEVLRQEAILTMNMVYKPGYSTAGTGVPALPEPPQPPDALPALSPPITPQVVPAAVPGTAAADAVPPANTESGRPNQPGTIPESAPPTAGPPPAQPASPPDDPRSPGPTAQPPAREVPVPPTQPTLPTPPEPPSPPVPPTPPEPPTRPQPPDHDQPPAPHSPAGVPLSDPSGQPGITGPIPGQKAPDQPGVIPPP